ncbi:MAG: hypothetical protein ABJA60_11455, partial [Nitrosospira sp.]
LGHFLLTCAFPGSELSRSNSHSIDLPVSTITITGDSVRQQVIEPLIAAKSSVCISMIIRASEVGILLVRG